MSEEILSLPILYQLASAFFAGLLSALTPCVYPLIPITLAVLGTHAAESKAKAFSLSFAYFIGIVFTYTILGIISAQAGLVFGSLLGNPWIVWGATAFLCALLLHTLDCWSIPGFHRLQQIGSSLGGSGIRGSFMMGMASGLIAAPCVGPVLVTILVLAASSESTWMGGTMLFSYSLGLGLPFLILGTFSSLLTKMPRAGRWMLFVKFLTAVGIVLTILYLHSPSVSRFTELLALQSKPLAIGGIFAFGILFAKLGHSNRRSFITIPAVLLISIPLYIATLYHPSPAPTADTTSAIAWEPNLEAAISSAQKKRMFIMADLFAEWCAACKELDSVTFMDPSVQALLKQLVPVRVDFTESTEHTGDLAEQYGVSGLPCILFLSPDGTEIPNTRISGFTTPEAFAAHLKKIIQMNIGG